MSVILLQVAAHVFSLGTARAQGASDQRGSGHDVRLIFGKLSSRDNVLPFHIKCCASEQFRCGKRQDQPADSESERFGQLAF